MFLIVAKIRKKLKETNESHYSIPRLQRGINFFAFAMPEIHLLINLTILFIPSGIECEQQLSLLKNNL